MSILSRTGSSTAANQPKCWDVLQTASGGTQFVLTQIGLSAFVWSETDHQYRPRTFNFYVFPKPVNGYDRRFLSQVCNVLHMLVLETSAELECKMMQGVGCHFIPTH